MANALAMVVIPMDSGVAKDAVVNTFSFETTGSVTDGAAAIDTALQNFYAALQSYWAADVNAPGVQLKLYDRADPKPRAPHYDVLLGLTGATGTTSMPHELSVCLSFQAARVSGTAQARRRGRIYFGPITSASIVGQFVETTALNAMKTAVHNFHTACTALPNVEWQVWSSVTGGSGSGSTVANGWVDNAIDIQRRRGVTASTKVVWP